MLFKEKNFHVWRENAYYFFRIKFRQDKKRNQTKPNQTKSNQTKNINQIKWDYSCWEEAEGWLYSRVLLSPEQVEAYAGLNILQPAREQTQSSSNVCWLSAWIHLRGIAVLLLFLLLSTLLTWPSAWGGLMSVGDPSLMGKSLVVSLKQLEIYFKMQNSWKQGVNQDCPSFCLENLTYLFGI